MNALETMTTQSPFGNNLETSLNSHSASRPSAIRFRGVTSFEYTLALAADKLQSYLTPRMLNDTGNDMTAKHKDSETLVEQSSLVRALLNDPFQTIPIAEAERLIHVCQNGPGAIITAYGHELSFIFRLFYITIWTKNCK